MAATATERQRVPRELLRLFDREIKLTPLERPMRELLIDSILPPSERIKEGAAGRRHMLELVVERTNGYLPHNIVKALDSAWRRCLFRCNKSGEPPALSWTSDVECALYEQRPASFSSFDNTLPRVLWTDVVGYALFFLFLVYW